MADVDSNSNSEQHGNPDGMKSLAKYSRMPIKRIGYHADAEATLIQEIDYGVLFIMAFWSGPSVKAFGEITELLDRLDPSVSLRFVAIDTDGAQPFYSHPKFVGKLGGWGEIAWIKSGVVQWTSGLGYNPDCFESNTRALLGLPAQERHNKKMHRNAVVRRIRNWMSHVRIR